MMMMMMMMMMMSLKTSSKHESGVRRRDFASEHSGFDVSRHQAQALGQP